MVAWVCSSWKAPRNRNSVVAGAGGGGGGSGIVLFHTDLVNGPKTGGSGNNGVWVTLFGRGFGTTRGSGTVTLGGGEVASYVSWSDTKIVVQLGAAVNTGNFTVTNNSAQSVTGCLSKPWGTTNDFIVRAGNIYFVTPSGTGNGALATPMSPTTAVQTKNAGDTFYFRGGAYNSAYGNSYGRNFAIDATNSGSANNHVAYVGYPGETATLTAPTGSGRSNFTLSQDTGAVQWFVISNLTMVGETGCVSHGGNTNGSASAAEQYRSGGQHIRVVGCDMRATYTGNTQSGSCTAGGLDHKMLSNIMRDTGVDPVLNNNHMIYIQIGASDVEVAWNHLYNLTMGHTIQVHTDRTFDQPFQPNGDPTGHDFLNVRIHSNLLESNVVGNCRGINIGNVGNNTTTFIYNNVLRNVGQSFSVIIFGAGTHDVYNNTLVDCVAGSGQISVASLYATTRIRNNLIVAPAGQTYIGQAFGGNASVQTVSNNLYSGAGSGPAFDPNPVNAAPQFVNAAAQNYRLLSTSPARDAGTSTGLSLVAPFDRDGVTRPQGSAPDIGAYEYVA